MPEIADVGDAARGGDQKLVPAPAPVELAVAELRGRPPMVSEQLAAVTDGDHNDVVLGQQRAMDAVRLAIGINAPGYNVYLSGLRTREERQLILRLLEEKAATMPTPGDWVYVNNFRNPESPQAIYLSAGEGVVLREQFQQLINFVIDELPKAFRREDFEQERTALRDKYNKRAQDLFNNLEASARARGLAVQSAPNGQVIFIPLIGGKMPESPEEIQRQIAAMSEEERARLVQAQAELQGEVANVMMRQQEMMRELLADLRAIERGFAARLITPFMATLNQRFNNPAVSDYLKEVADHILDHLDRFREAPAEVPGKLPRPKLPPSEDPRFTEYQVNVMVDNSGRRGAPVISEDAPNYRNIFGTIERWIDPLGRATTNFTRISAGSFLKAHGGFLVFDLEDAIVEPEVWKALKRSLKTGRMTLETYEPFPFFSSGLKPEPIEVQTKVLVLGGPYLYHALYFYDTAFSELFKIKAEVRPVIDANEDAGRHYAARVESLATRERLPHFDGSAIARLLEFGMRRAGDRKRVLSLMEPIDDLARESAYFARAENVQTVTSDHVERALSERMLRLNFIEEEIRRLIADNTIIVHLTGASVGQINGLAVLDVGGYSFGRPSRVTATVALGQAGVINIEREARLSGSTYDKGLMIITGFLRGRFGQERPLAMIASIAFEQSYSGVDGDSASSTELYALLSALSGVPIRQDLAVTGSADQYGTVQAIGGVNEKIEGFFRVCKAIGLTGTQGALVPRSNVQNLMLDPEIVAAVERGNFHIYPVDNIDQGIEILTGVRAGTIGEAGTINYLVDQRLKRMAGLMRDRPPAGETRVIEAPATPPAPTGPPPPPEPPR